MMLAFFHTFHTKQCPRLSLSLDSSRTRDTWDVLGRRAAVHDDAIRAEIASGSGFGCVSREPQCIMMGSAITLAWNLIQARSGRFAV
jgi:hypothetical protein